MEGRGAADALSFGGTEASWAPGDTGDASRLTPCRARVAGGNRGFSDSSHQRRGSRRRLSSGPSPEEEATGCASRACISCSTSGVACVLPCPSSSSGCDASCRFDYLSPLDHARQSFEVSLACPSSGLLRLDCFQ